MKTLCVLQHTEAEYLGLLEDHLESRSIRFQYYRPFTAGGTLPVDEESYDGLVLLGGGPFGVVSGHLVAHLGPELRIAQRFLENGKPVIGFGIGSILLAVAAGGGAQEAPLRFEVGHAMRVAGAKSEQMLPERFAYASYLRDSPTLPKSASVLAVDEQDRPLIFSVGDNAFGFVCHPGLKSAIVEDLIMEFEESPPNTAENLEKLRETQPAIAEALSEITVGLVRQCRWMEP